MKKFLIGLLVIVALVLLAATIFLPKQVNNSSSSTFICNAHSINRYVIDDKKWPSWWPGKWQQNDTSGAVYSHNGYAFTIMERQYDALKIRIEKGRLSVDTRILFLPLGIDSLRGEWSYTLSTSSNPISKIYLYFVSKEVKKELANVMKNMKLFLENPDKVYGVKIHGEIVKDTILVTTNFVSPQYPTMPEVYMAVDSIKNYIKTNHAKETNYPMMHVVHDHGIYKTQVAIPVNVTIPGTEIFPIKRMVPGNILVAEVTGGDYRAREAMHEMDIFIEDNRMSSPAIPFESLITDRIQQPDSTKWVTKIYYPVF